MTADASPTRPRTPAARLPQEIAAALDRGAQVLAANARAARALTRAFAEDARAAGLVSWPAPAIRDWAGWLEQSYAAIALKVELPLLLSPLQEELLWRRVQAAEAPLVVSPAKLARLAQGGYTLLSEYDAQASRRAAWPAAHEDAERFLGWARAFDAQCRQLGVLARAELTAKLREQAGALAATLPMRELLLVGFDRMTPAQQRLLQALDQAGVHAQQAAPGEPTPQRELVCAADEQQELEACALWVRARLQQEPGRRIGVLLPELQGARAQIDRVFRRVLLPHSAQRAAGGQVPYEFSLGAPLGSIPLVASALLLLRWLAGPLPAAELSSLLLGGFLARDAAEATALADTDAALRKAGLLTTELSLGSLLRHAEARSALLPPAVIARLRAAEAWARQQAARQRSYAEWVEAAAAQLAALGWPGFRELDSLAFQARERWDALLMEVARLGFAGDALRWSAFVRELTGFAQATLFAAESRNAPVQILGAAEASGQSFEAVWFLQVTEARWPARGRLHPLLAPGVQRDAGMPHTSAEVDLQLAEDQLRRILSSTGGEGPVMVSYARQSGGIDARPSPLLRGFSEISATVATQRALCETVCAPEPMPVAPWPLERVAGGSEVLKRQAACGFQSFAVKRLGADALEEESWGLDAGERATLLHRALEELWSAEPVGAGKLHSSDDLVRAFEDGTWDEILRAAIARSFANVTRAASGDAWRAAYLALEQKRLHIRLAWWLDVERVRAPFRVVGLEQRLEGACIGFAPGLAGDRPAGELRLNLRADRVDEVAGGRRLILDYKTADRVGPVLWQGERLDEPQLPIYALFGGIENVAGIAFAQIRPGRTRLHALAEDPSAQLGGPLRESDAPADKRLLPDETRSEWDQALRALAGQFARGEAPVNPKHGGQTCRICGLYGLCRVRSMQGGALADADDDEAQNAQDD